MLARINYYLASLSSNKYFIGLVMIFLNLGSKYVEINLSTNQERFIKGIAREVLIFTIAFMGTRDIVASLVLTGIFIILANYIFNENSNLCILPEKLKKLESAINRNNDNIISPDEINKAIEILDKAKKQEALNTQMAMINSLQNNIYN
jgi:hypothetical protein